VNNDSASALQSVNGIPNSVLNEVFAGKRRATNEMMGHRVDPAPSVMARMSQAFGMDFSGVQVYRSDAMNGTGMHGMAQGNKVVLGSDVDLNTQEGQAILGHEFSHIRAQSMGIGTGNGLLQDTALEHQADNEGLLAARGMSISGESMGMSTGLGMAGFEGLTPLGGGLSATASAPMQADNGGNKPDFFGGEKRQISDRGAEETENMQSELENMNSDSNYEATLNSIPWMMDKNDFHFPEDPKEQFDAFKEATDSFSKDIGKERQKLLLEKMKAAPTSEVAFSPVNGKMRGIVGLVPARIAMNFINFWGKGYSDDEMLQLVHELTAGATEIKDGKLEKNTDVNRKDPKHDKTKMHGINWYKDILYHKLLELERDFGTTLSEMHPRDVMQRIGAKKLSYYSQVLQDAQQMIDSNNSEATKQMLMEGSNDKGRDAEMKRLLDYYNPLLAGFRIYTKAGELGYGPSAKSFVESKSYAKNIRGPGMTLKEKERYNSEIREKIASGEYEETPEVINEQEEARERELKRRAAERRHLPNQKK